MARLLASPLARRSLFRPKVVLLTGLVLLIIIASIGFFYLTYVNRSTVHRTPTPTHILSAADVEATATPPRQPQSLPRTPILILPRKTRFL